MAGTGGAPCFRPQGSGAATARRPPRVYISPEADPPSPDVIDPGAAVESAGRTRQVRGDTCKYLIFLGNYENVKAVPACIVRLEGTPEIHILRGKPEVLDRVEAWRRG